MAESSVELDQQQVSQVLDVPEDHSSGPRRCTTDRTVSIDAALAMPPRKTVLALDVGEVAALENRESSGVDVDEDLDQESTTRQAWSQLDRLEQPPHRGTALLAQIGEHCHRRSIVSGTGGRAQCRVFDRDPRWRQMELRDLVEVLAAVQFDARRGMKSPGAAHEELDHLLLATEPGATDPVCT
ncbi:hypothetical protein ASH02_03680 [Nocardioides sp. Soil796]|nr:hypothetical protein ASH02_03680 [Nocardioides sp. Soil796]